MGAMFTAVVTVSGTVLAILGSMPLTVVYLTALGSLSAGMVITNQAATWQQRRTRLTPPAPLKAEVEVTEISAGWDGAAAAISVENRGPATAILGEILWVEGYSAASYRLEWEGESSANYPLEVGKHVTAVIASPKARPPEVEGVELHTGWRDQADVEYQTGDRRHDFPAKYFRYAERACFSAALPALVLRRRLGRYQSRRPARRGFLVSYEFLIRQFVRTHQRPQRVPEQVRVVPVVKPLLDLIEVRRKVLGAQVMVGASERPLQPNEGEIRQLRGPVVEAHGTAPMTSLRGGEDRVHLRAGRRLGA